MYVGSAYVVQAVNPSYLRKSALLKFAGGRFKPEVIGAGITDQLLEGNLHVLHQTLAFIQCKEYRTVQQNLCDAPDTPPELLYVARTSPLSKVFSNLSPQAVMVYHFFRTTITILNVTMTLVVRFSCRTAQPFEDLSCPVICSRANKRIAETNIFDLNILVPNAS